MKRRNFIQRLGLAIPFAGAIAALTDSPSDKLAKEEFTEQNDIDSAENLSGVSLNDNRTCTSIDTGVNRTHTYTGIGYYRGFHDPVTFEWNTIEPVDFDNIS